MDILAIGIIVAGTWLFDDVFNRKLQMGQKFLNLWSKDSSYDRSNEEADT
jgi:hypothetical protein